MHSLPVSPTITADCLMTLSSSLRCKANSEGMHARPYCSEHVDVQLAPALPAYHPGSGGGGGGGRPQ